MNLSLHFNSNFLNKYFLILNRNFLLCKWSAVTLLSQIYEKSFAVHIFYYLQIILILILEYVFLN